MLGMSRLSNIQTFIRKIFKLAMSRMAILMLATSRLATGTVVRVAKRVTSRWLQLPRKRSPYKTNNQANKQINQTNKTNKETNKLKNVKTKTFIIQIKHTNNQTWMRKT